MTVHVAQINIGTLLAPLDDPRIAPFTGALDAVNALADDAPGFVWRLQTEAGNATAIQVFPNPLELLNMSVWATIDDLKRYVYRSTHAEFFRRRAEWFEPDAKRVAIWHVAAGTIPAVDEGLRRADFLAAHGPSPYAFGFGRTPSVLLFEPTTPDQPGTLDLVSRLNQELTALADDPSENHFSLSAEQVTGGRGVMVRARLAGELVGCGAVRRIDDRVGELKRMFVDAASRGLKLGAAILDQLELEAGRLGMVELRLETGPRQPAAIALYEGAGYRRCDPWGEYLSTPATSLCYAKPLSG